LFRYAAAAAALPVPIPRNLAEKTRKPAIVITVLFAHLFGQTPPGDRVRCEAPAALLLSLSGEGGLCAAAAGFVTSYS